MLPPGQALGGCPQGPCAGDTLAAGWIRRLSAHAWGYLMWGPAEPAAIEFLSDTVVLRAEYSRPRGVLSLIRAEAERMQPTPRPLPVRGSLRRRLARACAFAHRRSQVIRGVGRTAEMGAEV